MAESCRKTFLYSGLIYPHWCSTIWGTHLLWHRTQQGPPDSSKASLRPSVSSGTALNTPMWATEQSLQCLARELHDHEDRQLYNHAHGEKTVLSHVE